MLGCFGVFGVGEEGVGVFWVFGGEVVWVFWGVCCG